MINRKLVEIPVRMMNRMEEITDLICEYNEEVQKQQQEIERLNNIINKALRKLRANIWNPRHGFRYNGSAWPEQFLRIYQNGWQDVST